MCSLSLDPEGYKHAWAWQPRMPEAIIVRQFRKGILGVKWFCLSERQEVLNLQRILAEPAVVDFVVNRPQDG